MAILIFVHMTLYLLLIVQRAEDKFSFEIFHKIFFYNFQIDFIAPFYHCFHFEGSFLYQLKYCIKSFQVCLHLVVIAS